MSNLIPFALRISDQQYVDVSDVPKGKACGCICPSCEMPLQARQGRKNTWHFSHHSHEYEEVEEECRFSKWVSIVAMAKQFIEKMDYISVPKYEKFNSETGLLKEITPEKERIDLKDAEIKETLENIHVNAILKVKNKKEEVYSIGIIFSYPKMAQEISLSDLQKTKKVGLLEICLTNFDVWFPTGTKNYNSLKDKIQQDNSIKKWLYHPNENTDEFGCFDTACDPSEYIDII